jgi:hypothetical protein
MEEVRFPGGFDDAAQGMVNDPVAEGSCTDQPTLGFVDGEVSVGPGLVGLLSQFSLQCVILNNLTTFSYGCRLCRWHGFLPVLFSNFLRKEYRLCFSIVKVQGGMTFCMTRRGMRLCKTTG